MKTYIIQDAKYPNIIGSFTKNGLLNYCKIHNAIIGARAVDGQPFDAKKCEKGIYSAVISDIRDADFNFKSRAVNIHVIEISRY